MSATATSLESQSYPQVRLYIAGNWCEGASQRRQAVLNPATGTTIGSVAQADRTDLDAALAAADAGFRLWRAVPAFERYKIMREAAGHLQRDAAAIARVLTLEQGKPLTEAATEVAAAVGIIEWFAEEARRTYGRVVPARAAGIQQLIVKEPVGPVAAFTPWNFPINQAVRKVAAALAAGCSIILKGPEETPASCAALIGAFAAAGVPAGVVNLVFGVPHEISSYLIAHPVIRKVTFTGSTAVGKRLAELAGAHMKRVTMELGGHAPALVFADADIEAAARSLCASKFRNAGQTCISPTRILVHAAIHDDFVSAFTAAAKQITVGDGLVSGVQMGPLVNERRIAAMTSLVADAVARGARVPIGGARLKGQGFFFAPTLLTELRGEARVMNEEPFGPLAPIIRFESLSAAIGEANRLSYGLGAYAYTRSLKTAADIGAALECGMVSINHQGLGLPEIPFGGVKDSGYGSEGGCEAMDAYLNTKLITQMGM